MAKVKEDAQEIQWRAWLADLGEVRNRKRVPLVALPIEVEKGGKTCVFRFTPPGGKGETTRSLGKVTQRLADIVRKAEELNATLARGIDPREEERREKEAAAEARKRQITVRGFGEKYMEGQEARWKTPVHRAQWYSTLRTHAWPIIGDMPIADVGNTDILKVLKPIWHDIPETAGRVRGRLEAILEAAHFEKLHPGPNPAVWKGNLSIVLPSRTDIRPVVHHPALPWREMASFMAMLRARHDSFGALALEFAILTAARSGEVRNCRWSEIDLAAALWTVPAPKMKARREHRVPLSAPALAVLARAMALRESDSPDSLVFPGSRPGVPLSDMTLGAVLKRMGRDDLTTHGFRSSFSDWASETGKPADIKEAALAHIVGDKTVAAYQRGDLLERRRALMNQWADFCEQPGPRAATAEAMLMLDPAMA